MGALKISKKSAYHLEQRIHANRPAVQIRAQQRVDFHGIQRLRVGQSIPVFLAHAEQGLLELQRRGPKRSLTGSPAAPRPG